LKQWRDAETARLSGREVLKILGEFGFQDFAQRSSHVKLRRTVSGGRNQTITVPNHAEIDRGTLHAIYRQAYRFIPESELRSRFFTD
jgi:predicted RNA binding protein YcfA (HicA-like mRNA interferase family)